MITEIINKKSVIELILNPDGLLFIEELGQEMKHHGQMTPTEAMYFINEQANNVDKVINEDFPSLDCELKDGSRFHASIPPIVDGPCFNIRIPTSKVFTLDDYLFQDSLTSIQKDFIESAILERKNFVIVGGTSSGKTTFTNAIINSIEKLTPHHRIIIIEDISEIQCTIQNKVKLYSNQNYSLRQHVKDTLRKRPDRIIVGEVRGSEALDLLKSWNTGHPGGVATIHANSALGAISRIEQLILEVSINPMKELIAEAVDIIIYLEKTNSGRKIREIISINGFENSNYNIERI